MTTRRQKQHNTERAKIFNRVVVQRKGKPLILDKVIKALAACGLPRNKKIYNAKLRELLRT